MSWDAYLTDDRGHREGDWTYTHNVNGMIAAAYLAETGKATEQCSGPLGPAIGAAWWGRLNGATGPDGRDDTLLPVLRAMCDAIPDWPTTWRVSG